MEHKESSRAYDMWSSILPFLSELTPLFMEKWADVHDRPLIRNLEEDVRRLRRKSEQLLNRVRWLYAFVFALLIWNVFLTIFLVLALTVFKP